MLRKERIFAMSRDICKNMGTKLFWETMKDSYQKLKTDDEKNEFLARLWQGLEKKED